LQHDGRGAPVRAEHVEHAPDLVAAPGEVGQVARQHAQVGDHVGFRARRRHRLLAAEDVVVEAFQHRARPQPQLPAERLPQALELGERLGLPAAAVQGEHLAAAQALPERMRPHPLGEHVGELRVPPEVELGLGPVLERGQPQVGEPGRLRRGQRQVRQLGQRVAAPQLQGLAEQPPGRAEVAAAQRPPSRPHQLGEAEHVEPVRGQPQPVAGRDVAQLVAQAEVLAQGRDVDLEVLVRGTRRGVVPERLDEGGHRHHVVDPGEQDGQEDPPLRGAEVEPCLTPARLKRPEHGELHVHDGLPRPPSSRIVPVTRVVAGATGPIGVPDIG
jgi:hypothetical protein